MLCVVEDPRSVFLFEQLGTYNGEYHVLQGLISPLDGIFILDNFNCECEWLKNKGN